MLKPDSNGFEDLVNEYLNTPSSPKLAQSDTNSAIFAPRCPRCRSTICPQV